VETEGLSTDRNRRAVYQIETEGLSIKQKQKGCLQTKYVETEGLSTDRNRRAVYRVETEGLSTTGKNKRTDNQLFNTEKKISRNRRAVYRKGKVIGKEKRKSRNQI